MFLRRKSGVGGNRSGPVPFAYRFVADPAHEIIVQNRKYPDAKRAARLILVRLRIGRNEGFLDEIVRVVFVPRQLACIAHQRGYQIDNA